MNQPPLPETPFDKARAFASKACVCTHAGILNLAQPLFEELSAAQATIAEMRNENMCDVCAGTGEPVSGKPCICNGTGMASVAFTELRRQNINQIALEGRTDDSLARQIAEALCINPNLEIRVRQNDWSLAVFTDLLPFIQSLLAPLQMQVTELVNLGLDQTKLIAQQHLDLRQAESQLSAFRDALKGCVEALEECYNVTDYPADGQTIQDQAITTANELLKGDGK